MFCSLWLFMALKSISFTEAMTFSPLLYDPHVLQWDYSCKASSAHAEALRKTGVTLYWPISEISCLALHFGPWETSSQQPHHFLLCQFLNPSRKDAAWKAKLSGFQCLRTRTPGVWAPTAVSVVWAEVQLASYSKAAASLLWSLVCEGVHSAAFPVKESKRLHTVGLHLWVLHFPSYPLVMGGWHRAGWIYVHATKNLFQHHSREKYFQSFSLCWISATIKVQNWGLIGI